MVFIRYNDISLLITKVMIKYNCFRKTKYIFDKTFRLATIFFLPLYCFHFIVWSQNLANLKQLSNYLNFKIFKRDPQKVWIKWPLKIEFFKNYNHCVTIEYLQYVLYGIYNELFYCNNVVVLSLWRVNILTWRCF